MNTKRTQTKVAGSLVLAIAQCILGGALFLIFGIITVGVTVGSAWSDMGYGYSVALMVVFLVLTLAGALLLMRGIQNCRVISHVHKITAVMAGKSREKLTLISGVTGQNISQLVRSLRRLSVKGFFPGAYVDLYRRDFVVQTGGPLPPFTPGPTVLREVQKKSVLPIYLFGGVWLVYALVFPLYAWHHFVIVLVVASVAAIVAHRILPTHTAIVEELRKVEPPPKPEKIDTGNEELDEVLTAAMGYMTQLTALDVAITNPKIDGPVQELVHICKQIFDYIKKTPGKVRQIRQFMNYYLPTTISLLQNYDELSREPVKGQNIQEAMTKIEGTMESILTAFQKQLDNLYQDRALDISVDIEVMQSMMDQEGLSGEPLQVKGEEQGQEK